MKNLDKAIKYHNELRKIRENKELKEKFNFPKKLEELGIGRPSTYAPTISKIMEVDRGYITKESREGVERIIHIIELKGGVITHKQKKEITGTTKNMLYPSDIGMVVSDFLSEHFGKIMEYGFTANVENQLDKIATDGLDWKGMLQEFYKPFHLQVTETMEQIGRASCRERV